MPTTRRLGNLLDIWYFASLGSVERQSLLQPGSVDTTWQHGPCDPCHDDECLGAHLQIDDGIAHGLPEEVRTELIKQSNIFWASYSIPHIRMAMPHIRYRLGELIGSYQRRYPQHVPVCKYDCVVHYRVGDFLEMPAAHSGGNVNDPPQNQTIPTYAVASAVADAAHPGAFIGIADGGSTHGVSCAARSAQSISQLIQDLRSAGMTGRIETFHGDVDADFLICARAPVLVTGPGSFAMMAAAANARGVIRTPAAQNLNFPRTHGQREPEEIAPNWHTYSY